MIKTHYFSIFFKKFNKPCVNFWRVWTKNTNFSGNFEKILKVFDENSFEKLNFIIIFWKIFLLKIELSEITPFFLNNFFGFGGYPPSLPKSASDETALQEGRKIKSTLTNFLMKYRFSLLDLSQVCLILSDSRFIQGGFEAWWLNEDCLFKRSPVWEESSKILFENFNYEEANYLKNRKLRQNIERNAAQGLPIILLKKLAFLAKAIENL